MKVARFTTLCNTLRQETTVHFVIRYNQQKCMTSEPRKE